MVKLLGGTLAVFLLGSASSGPQDKHKPASSGDPQVTFSFRQLDSDGDGKVTREEFAQAFARLDRNHDGVLTADEAGGHGPTAPKEKRGKAKPAKGKRKH